MDIAPIAADAPRMQRALAFLAGLFPYRCPGDVPRALEHPAKPNINPPPRSGDLGPKQLAWLEEKLPFFGVYKKQADAPTGVAVVLPEPRS